ncbi:MAG: thiamine-phosphate kinase [Sphingobium sp.]
MTESDFIARLRGLATDPAARGLMDDAAVLGIGDTQIVLTHDMLVEGVHYLPDDPAETVAWKLVAVNASDLSAKGAAPLGVLLGFSLAGDSDWDREFVRGLEAALSHFGVPLLGGDTVAMPSGAPRTLGMTAIGTAPSSGAPSRAGARPGDLLFAVGPIGDAGLGLALLRGELEAEGEVRASLVDAYRRPMPDPALGAALAPLATAMADISDGLLIDASRIAAASGCAVEVDLSAVPLSAAFVAVRGDQRESRLFAATAGDDYRLILALDPARVRDARALADRLGRPIWPIGACTAGEGVSLSFNGEAMPLPASLGYEHGSRSG